MICNLASIDQVAPEKSFENVGIDNDDYTESSSISLKAQVT